MQPEREGKHRYLRKLESLLGPRRGLCAIVTWHRTGGLGWGVEAKVGVPGRHAAVGKAKVQRGSPAWG